MKFRLRSTRKEKKYRKRQTRKLEKQKKEQENCLRNSKMSQRMVLAMAKYIENCGILALAWFKVRKKRCEIGIFFVFFFTHSSKVLIENHTNFSLKVWYSIEIRPRSRKKTSKASNYYRLRYKSSKISDFVCLDIIFWPYYSSVLISTTWAHLFYSFARCFSHLRGCPAIITLLPPSEWVCEN